MGIYKHKIWENINFDIFRKILLNNSYFILNFKFHKQINNANSITSTTIRRCGKYEDRAFHFLSEAS